ATAFAAAEPTAFAAAEPASAKPAASAISSVTAGSVQVEFTVRQLSNYAGTAEGSQVAALLLHATVVSRFTNALTNSLSATVVVAASVTNVEDLDASSGSGSTSGGDDEESEDDESALETFPTGKPLPPVALLPGHIVAIVISILCLVSMICGWVAIDRVGERPGAHSPAVYHAAHGAEARTGGGGGAEGAGSASELGGGEVAEPEGDDSPGALAASPGDSGNPVEAAARTPGPAAGAVAHFYRAGIRPWAASGLLLEQFSDDEQIQEGASGNPAEAAGAREGPGAHTQPGGFL
ncbi:hypothetical protein T492DRAFT_877631, partial [Pavlovales sp. CCMP2436]